MFGLPTSATHRYAVNDRAHMVSSMTSRSSDLKERFFISSSFTSSSSPLGASSAVLSVDNARLCNQTRKQLFNKLEHHTVTEMVMCR